MTENGIQINVDREATVFNKGGNLIELLEDFCTERRTRFQRGPPQGNFNARGRGGRGGYNNQRQNAPPPPPRVNIDKNFRFDQRELRTLNEKLKGLSFYASHLKYKPKLTIKCLSDKPVNEIFFELNDRDGKTSQISVKEYYDKHYKDRLDTKILGNLLCIIDNKKNNYPLEIVEIIQDQCYNSKLDTDQQAKMTTVSKF